MKLNKIIGAGVMFGGFILAVDPPRYGGLFGSMIFLAAGLIVTLMSDKESVSVQHTVVPDPAMESKVRELQQQVEILSNQVSSLTEQHEFVHELLSSRSTAQNKITS